MLPNWGLSPVGVDIILDGVVIVRRSTTAGGQDPGDHVHTPTRCASPPRRWRQPLTVIEC